MASLSVSLSASISRTTLLIFKKFSARVNFFISLIFRKNFLQNIANWAFLSSVNFRG